MLAMFYHCQGHALIYDPPARGALTMQTPLTLRTVDKNAPEFFHAYWPSGVSGDLSINNGKENQIETLDGHPYQSFEPQDEAYRWPLGVCGDYRAGDQVRLRGGIYYFGGKIVQTYVEGSIIDIGLNMQAHHRGYMEFHMCDVSKCGGEISEECFRIPGACHSLKRAVSPACESGATSRCLPIDKSFPERWYVPCSLKHKFYMENMDSLEAQGIAENRIFESWDAGTIQYKLPEGFRCDHCVLHFHWVTGNSCNAPGVREYFTGTSTEEIQPPEHLKCAFDTRHNTCGVDRYPEQYFSCSDVRILPKNETNALPTKTPSPGIPSVVNGSIWQFKYNPRDFRKKIL